MTSNELVDSSNQYFKMNESCIQKGYQVIWTQWEEEDTINFYCLSPEEYAKFKQYHERTQYGTWGICNNIRFIHAQDSCKELVEYDMISDNE
jgi:hypothetical protein